MSTPADTLISQYANSPRIRALIDLFDECANPAPAFDLFYTSEWNINTASGFGLDVIGSYVGISRTIRVPQGQIYFGFSESFGCQPFGQAPFYNGYPVYDLSDLPDDAYRKLIFLKSLSNITALSVDSINHILLSVYGEEGRAYVLTPGAMTIYYVFEFPLTPQDLSILSYSGVLARPTGVEVKLLQMNPSSTFGFAGSGLQPFGQGTFFQGVVNVS